MFLYSLTQKEVSLEDKLNGFTVKKAKMQEFYIL